MTVLRDILNRQITRLGPMNIADYMAAALYHPEHGYYTTKAPLGAAGDFTTAPEISQMFGELVGLSLAQNWLDQGAPAPFVLAELGPGSGQLMADILRAARRVPGFLAAVKPVLVECSPMLRAQQSTRLSDFAPECSWVDQIADIPEAPLWCVANEFFDCLPIRQFVHHNQWREQVVSSTNGALTFATRVAPELGWTFPDRPKGSVIELRPAANAIMSELSRRIADRGGAALIIDYGADGSDGDTLQALQHHTVVHPLSAPGATDLTAHVDFAALRAAAQNVTVSPTTSQGLFLQRLGISERAKVLAQAMKEPQRSVHMAAYQRLTAAQKMGELFKVIGLAPIDAPLPPGVDPCP